LNNQVAILICLLLLIIVACITILACLTKSGEKCFPPFLALCLAIISWIVLHGLYFIASDPGTSKMIYYMHMIPVPYVSVFALIGVLKLYDMEKYTNKKIVAALFVIPTITMILSLTNDSHFLFRNYFEILQTVPVHIAFNIYGPWYNVHVIYSYCLICITAVISSYKSRDYQRFYRLPFYLVILACISGTALKLIDMIVSLSTLIDLNLVGATLSILFFYFAIDAKETNKYAIARNEIFESMNEIILILNLDNYVIDYNRAAQKWAANMNIQSLKNRSFKDFISLLKEKGAQINNKSAMNVYETEIYFPENNNSVFKSYNLKRQYIVSRSGEKIGIIVSFSDITNMVKTLRNLTEISTIDALTGLFNRRGYDKVLHSFNKEENFPLCVVIGDVNGLKRVNDTFGHITGDLLLQSFAVILIEATKGIGTVARIGGDEFALMLPSTGEERALEIIDTIRNKIASKKEDLFGCSIALGYAIKTNMLQTIEETIDTADKDMYTDKRNERRSR